MLKEKTKQEMLVIKATPGGAEGSAEHGSRSKMSHRHSPESQLPGNHKCFKQPLAIVHGESAVCGCREQPLENTQEECAAAPLTEKSVGETMTRKLK